MLYRRFDALFALSENGGAGKLRASEVPNVDVVPLGVEVGEFGPAGATRGFARKLGLSPTISRCWSTPADSIGEKKPELVADAFRQACRRRSAPSLRCIGEGPLKAEIAALRDKRIILPGYVRGRPELARWLASADIYVSGMADETFGISIIEAQASGLPVVGVAAGAMIDRVTEATSAAWPGRRCRGNGCKHPRRMVRRPRARWPTRRGLTRCSSAGSAAWKRCSGGFIRRRSRARAGSAIGAPAVPAANLASA